MLCPHLKIVLVSADLGDDCHSGTDEQFTTWFHQIPNFMSNFKIRIYDSYLVFVDLEMFSLQSLITKWQNILEFCLSYVKDMSTICNECCLCSGNFRGLISQKSERVVERGHMICIELFMFLCSKFLSAQIFFFRILKNLDSKNRSLNMTFEF